MYPENRVCFASNAGQGFQRHLYLHVDVIRVCIIFVKLQSAEPFPAIRGFFSFCVC